MKKLPKIKVRKVLPKKAKTQVHKSKKRYDRKKKLDITVQE